MPPRPTRPTPPVEPMPPAPPMPPTPPATPVPRTLPEPPVKAPPKAAQVPFVCSVCLTRAPTETLPFAKCLYCGMEPSFHHGRCCPQNVLVASAVQTGPPPLVPKAQASPAAQVQPLPPQPQPSPDPGLTSTTTSVDTAAQVAALQRVQQVAAQAADRLRAADPPQQMPAGPAAPSGGDSSGLTQSVQAVADFPTQPVLGKASPATEAPPQADRYSMEALRQRHTGSEVMGLTCEGCTNFVNYCVCGGGPTNSRLLGQGRNSPAPEPAPTPEPKAPT